MSLAPHNEYNGPYDEFGQKHGVSMTREGKEVWAHGYLNDDPASGCPAQVTRFIDGSTRITFAQMGMPHATGFSARQWKNSLGDVYMYEDWQFGLRHGTQLVNVGSTIAITQMRFGKRHGYESKQYSGSDIVMLRKWECDNLVDGGKWTTRRGSHRPDLAAQGLFAESSTTRGSAPIASNLHLAARAIVDLSPADTSGDPADTELSSSASDRLVADTPLLPISRVKRVQPKQPKQRPERVRKVPARYRSSHY